MGSRDVQGAMERSFGDHDLLRAIADHLCPLRDLPVFALAETLEERELSHGFFRHDPPPLKPQ